METENSNVEEINNPELTSDTLDADVINEETVTVDDTVSIEDDKKKNDKRSFLKKKKSNKEVELEAKVEELTAKLTESNEKHLRLYSEFDNFRKRTNKEKLDLIKNASEEMIISLLPVLDDFERAHQHMEKSTDIEAIKEGEKLIFSKFKSILENKGIKAMQTLEQTFDPEIHEALTQIPAPTEELKGKVIDEIQKGYLLNEKVIRFAKVVVGQ